MRISTSYISSSLQFAQAKIVDGTEPTNNKTGSHKMELNSSKDRAIHEEDDFSI
jgi:hypothetical protein